MADKGYSFGDSEAAARRLDLVSSIFDPPSVELLLGAAGAPPRLVIDLGCGPGNTTRRVHETTAALRTVGLERSPAFVAEARRRNATRVGLEFIEHDVTLVPFPVTGADLIFARLVLAHLPAVPATVAAWSSQLAPRGVLVLDEVDAIDTDNPVFADYLRVVTGMIASRHADMYAGRSLAAMDPPPGAHVVTNAVRRLSVSTATVAEMFGLNLSVWRGDPYVVANHATLVAALPARLLELRASTRADEIEWGLRQVVLCRDA